MTIIGITGELCSGKTTVSECFKNLGAKVIDADILVHRFYKTDKAIKKSIRKEFGKKIFKGGEIDRAKLGEIVFNKRAGLRKLCRIVHPKVIEKIKAEAKANKTGALVIDAPLLIEAALHKIVDYVVLVKADQGEQLRRCQKKGWSGRKARNVLNAQIAAERKIKYADFVIDNNGTRKELKKKAKSIWKEINNLRAN